MTGKINPITVTVDFKGQIYLAKITPTINGKDVDPTDSMRQAEAAKQIYRKQLQAMLQRHEADPAEKGLLKEATMKGFICENGLFEHAEKTQDLWAKFADSLQSPSAFLSPDKIEEVDDELEAGTGAKAAFIDISAYATLSPNDKKQVHALTYLNAVAQGCFKKEADFPKEQLQYLKKCGINPGDAHNHTTPLFLKLRKKAANNDEKLSHPEMAYVMRQVTANEAAAQSTSEERQ